MGIRVGYLVLAGYNKKKSGDLYILLNERFYDETYLSDFQIPKSAFPFYDCKPLAQKAVDAAKNTEYAGPIVVVGDKELLEKGLTIREISGYLKMLKHNKKTISMFIKKNNLYKGSQGVTGVDEIIEQGDAYGTNIKIGLENLLDKGCSKAVVLLGDSPKISSGLVNALIKENNEDYVLNFPVVAYESGLKKYRPGMGLLIDKKLYKTRVVNSAIVNLENVDMGTITKATDRISYAYKCRKVANPVNWFRLANFFGGELLYHIFKGLKGGFIKEEVEDYISKKLGVSFRILPLMSEEAIQAEHDIDSFKDARKAIKEQTRNKARGHAV
ncbi:MAG TPA: hypothetical protein ENN30_02545 [Candidatus Woesearchaeota archaeon]|nr:hypothetical protein [Candidatus Woesearchaeota archaeon]